VTALEGLLDALAARIAAHILVAGERDTYTSRDLPRRCSRRRFAELCRSGVVSGARRDGREWVCSREAWEAARTRAPAHSTRNPSKPTSLDAKADALLARSGLRIVRGVR
jgi:hypothetical protein